MVGTKSTTSVLSERSRERRKRTVSRDGIKTCKSMYRQSNLPSSRSDHLTTSGSAAINTNYSKARLDLLTAKVAETSSSNIAQEGNIKLTVPAMPEYSDGSNIRLGGDTNPVLIKRSATVSSFGNLMRKYSETNRDYSLPEYQPTHYRAIMKKYSSTNGEDIMRKYGASVTHGDILRQYTVDEYDKSLENYSPTRCEMIIKKYASSSSPSTTNAASENGSRSSKSRSQSSRKSGRSSSINTAMSNAKHGGGQARKRSSSRYGDKQRLFSKDNNSTTKMGSKIQKSNLVKGAAVKQTLRKNNARSMSPKFCKITNNGGVKRGRSNSLTGKKRNKSSDSVINRRRRSRSAFQKKRENGFDELRKSAKRVNDYKMNHLGSLDGSLSKYLQHHHNKEQKQPQKQQHRLQQQQRLQQRPVQTRDSSSCSVGHNPSLKSYSGSLREDGAVTTLTIPSTTTMTRFTVPYTYSDNSSDGVDYYDETLDESDLRLQHLLSRQAKVSSFVPSTPVDRKDLRMSTPGSIYEKLETENRGKKYKRQQQLRSASMSKTQLSTNPKAAHRNHPKKGGGVKNILEKIKHNRADNFISALAGGASAMSLDSQRRQESSTNMSVCSDCLEGRFRSLSCRECEALRYHEKIAGSQKRAYEVYVETGERAKKPGDLMEIVRYMNNDADDADAQQVRGGAEESGGRFKNEEEGKVVDGNDVVISGHADSVVRHLYDEVPHGATSSKNPSSLMDKDNKNLTLGPHDDFINEYSQFQKDSLLLLNAGGKENVSPADKMSSASASASDKARWQQSATGRSLDEMRRQSVDSWLKKRGRYVRCKLGQVYNRG